jgi:hypothetical protein
MLDGGKLSLPSSQDGLRERLEGYKRRYDSLKGSTERSNCENHWQQVGEVMSPRKIDFVGMRTPGEKKMNQVYDPTGIHSNELLAAGLHGMATNPAMKWFSLRLVTQRVVKASGGDGDINEDTGIQKYLSDVEGIMWERIYQPGSNFTTALHETYLDLGAFGTAVMFVGQRDDGGLLFESRPLAEVVIAENAEGRVDTVFRKSKYTVRQLIQMGKSEGWKVSDKVKDLFLKEKYDDEVDVIHVVTPRADREPNKKDSKNMPWASCYFEHGECHLLNESGFPEFPFLIPRWSKYAGEVYGRSPGMSALPDVKMLQVMTLAYVKTLQKNADPPMWIQDDGRVGQQLTVPGGVNYFRGNPHDGVMLMPTSLQGLQAQGEFMEMIRNRIRTAFFTDILQINTDAEMTATEVMQRTAERMRLLGPLIGRLESELLGPMVERIFGILNRLKKLPVAPKSVQNSEFTVEYVSPIATAQKQQAVNGMMQVSQAVNGMVGPELAAQVLAKRLNPDKIVAFLWDLFNNDPDLLRSEDEMAESEQAQKTQQALQVGQPAMDMVGKGAGAARDLAQAAQSGGIDMKQLLAQFQGQVAQSPEAKSDIAQLGQRASDAFGGEQQQAAA